DTPTGQLATRGNRQLFLLGTSLTQTRRARELITTHSFDKLFKHGKKDRLLGPNVAYIRL
ncbi:Hypothetical protein PFR_JS25-2_1, partial [Propionibacterium freudenreichii]